MPLYRGGFSIRGKEGSSPVNLFPNLPVDYNIFDVQTWSIAPTTDPSPIPWFLDAPGDAAKTSIINSPGGLTPPASPPEVLQVFFKEGEGGGDSPTSIRRTFSSEEQCTQFYLGFYRMVSDPFSNAGNSGTKDWWLSSFDEIYGPATYTGYDEEDLEYMFFQQPFDGGPDRKLSCNVGGDPDALKFINMLGEWHLYEILLTMNSASGVGDGIWSLYLDNELRIHYTDVNFYSNIASRKLTSNRHEPTFGGGTNDPPFDQYFWTDHTVMAGRN